MSPEQIIIPGRRAVPNCRTGTHLSRRHLLRDCGYGLGAIALSSLLNREKSVSASESTRRNALMPLAGPIKSIIVLHMGGGVSQVDSFDPKPVLEKFVGQDVPPSIAKLVPKGNMRLRTSNLMPSLWEFHQRGECGMPVSELFPEIANHVDDLCVIRSMKHDSPIHTPADYLTLTGSLTGQRPSWGAWLAYGLGSENENLPAFVSMSVGDNFSGPALWGSGFLPPEYQGVNVNGTKGLSDVQLPDGVTLEQRRSQMDWVNTMNREHLDRLQVHEEMEARIRSYELAFRMQTSAPEVFDLAGETNEVRILYGLDRKESAEFGTNCLLARRFVERGVRCVQLIGAGWDAHTDIRDNHTKQASMMDLPIAGLLSDLKRTGLLKSTLVVWGGEFGRTPTVEGDPKKPGRDHNPAGYTIWLAGGNIRGGQIVGATDEVGYTAVERPVHPNDLHATMLHALGLDERAITFNHSGRNEILTNLGGIVIEEVFR
jgi:Protein of unknown function (DUF1501)